MIKDIELCKGCISEELAENKIPCTKCRRIDLRQDYYHARKGFESRQSYTVIGTYGDNPSGGVWKDSWRWDVEAESVPEAYELAIREAARGKGGEFSEGCYDEAQDWEDEIQLIATACTVICIFAGVHRDIYEPGNIKEQ